MSILTKVRKRNGDVVEFEPERIQNAIEKAALSTEQRDLSFIVPLTAEVVELMEKKFADVENTPDVEMVQDMVEKTLMKDGFYEIAKAYILYREQQSEKRTQEMLVKMDQKQLTVEKRNGEKVPFDVKKLETAVGRAIVGFEDVIDAAEVAEAAKRNMFDGITTADIDKAVVMTMKARIERDPAYTYATARMFMNGVYKEVLGADLAKNNFQDKYRNMFAENIQLAIDNQRMSESLLDYDIADLSAYLDIERDNLFTYLGAQTLYDRYFIHIEGRRIETPQYFWMRVAMGLASQESDKQAKAKEFYDVLSQLLYVNSTPTLFNAGTCHQQLSSCYLSTVNDDLGHIFKFIGDDAQLSKWAGGLGNDWTNVRATGSHIKGTNGSSQGVIPFLKIANDTAVAVNQGGKRKGAMCAYLESWHLDIEDFLELRKNTGDERRRTHDMNTANWIPDLFMKRVESAGTWTLFSPNDVKDLHDLYGAAFEKRYEEYEKMTETGEITHFKKVEAKDLWRKMLTMLFETGHPWITFKDPCNVRSPQDHMGVIHSSNLCTEITLNTSAEETAVCNLGSVNLKKHIKDGKLDQELVKKTVTTAMRMLDNVVDINFYPTKEAKTSNLRHRPVGLGVMGLQDALYILDLNFGSDEAVEFSHRSQEMIAYYALDASSDLAKERGTYESYKGSKWDRGIFPHDTVALLEQERGQKIPTPTDETMDWGALRTKVAEQGMRNSNCMAIAPTATISNISGVFPCIEPIYKNMYVKSNLSGEFTIVNAYLIEDLKALGLWSNDMSEQIKYHDGSIQQIEEIPEKLRAKYKEVFEIDASWLIKHAAHRGRWIDQSQSVNIFVRGVSGKKLHDIYFQAWKLGMKTTYYLRSLGISQVEKSTVNSAKYGFTHKRDTGEVPPASDALKGETNSTSSQVAPNPADEDAVMCSILNGPECDACQ
ncbi:MAG: ribonucleoside-diphosphate reductase subunit alpha [Candidatus Gracilibacteria bacterium]|nr:ribonucleoside-diphosphate reductase subunit alpha [Candidatus Gracilibacteria bacterium]